MTGNKNMWRAPLAGLASLAMVATMGVAASTANAAASDGQHDVSGALTVSGVWKDESVAEAALRVPSPFTPSAYGYYSDSAKTAPFKVTSPISGDEFVYADSASSSADYVKVTLALDADSAQVVDGVKRTGSTDVYVKKGSKVGVLHSVADAANYKLVTKWTATFTGSSTTTTDYDSPEDIIVPDDATSVTIAPAAGSVVNASVVRFSSPWGDNSKAHLKGALIDGGGDPAAYTVDALPGTTVDVPAAVYDGSSDTAYVEYWQDAAGNKVTGDKVTANGDTTYTAVTTQSGVFVSFNSNGGTAVDPVRVKTDKTITAPADPTREGFDFYGWALPVRFSTYDKDAVKTVELDGSSYTVIADFSGVYFNAATTLTAVWAKTYDIKVTFHYGDYEGAPADEIKTVNANSYIAEPETPTREGYVLDHWYVEGDTAKAKFNFDTKLAKEGNNGANFTLVAEWHRATTDEALNALNYVQSKDYVNGSIGVNAGKTAVDDADYFTSSTWKAFLGEYKKAYQEYKAARQLSPEIDSKTAADVVNTLTAAWKDLRFTSANADTTLNGREDFPDATAKVVYRLSRANGLHHLLTGDEFEVWSLTNNTVGVGGWTRDETTFRTINTAAKTTNKWIEGTKDNSDLGFSPLVKKVTRLYNAQLQEHMYTSDANEVKVLTAGDWTEDSNEAAFFVPALYTTKTKVVRLYNPSTHLHLYTSDTNEVKVLTTKGGWTLDGDAASFYAL